MPGPGSVHGAQRLFARLGAGRAEGGASGCRPLLGHQSLSPRSRRGQQPPCPTPLPGGSWPCPGRSRPQGRARSRWPVCSVAPGRPSDTGQGESRHPPHGGMLHGPPPGRGFTRRQLEGGRGQRDRDGVASDNGPVGRKDRGAVLGSRRRGRAGRGAAARVHVGVGALDGRPAGALHGHRLLVGAGLPAARALPLHGLGLRGVPGTHSALRARPPPAARSQLPWAPDTAAPPAPSSWSEHVGALPSWPGVALTPALSRPGTLSSRTSSDVLTPWTPPRDPALAQGRQLAVAWADLGQAALPAALAQDSGPQRAPIPPHPQWTLPPGPWTQVRSRRSPLGALAGPAWLSAGGRGDRGAPLGTPFTLPVANWTTKDSRVGTGC